MSGGTASMMGALGSEGTLTIPDKHGISSVAGLVFSASPSPG